jgi:hypothetical protein
VASLSTQLRKFLVIGAFSAAAVAGPALALSVTPDASVQAGPACLAWFGNKEDGNCLGTSTGNGATFGTPSFGLCGGGICSGSLLPGNTWNTDIGIG